MLRLRLAIPQVLCLLGVLGEPATAAARPYSASTQPAPSFETLGIGSPPATVTIHDDNMASPAWDSFVEPEGAIVHPMTVPIGGATAEHSGRNLLPASVMPLEPGCADPEMTRSFWPLSCTGGWLGGRSRAAGWTTRVDGLGLWRNSPKSQPLFTSLSASQQIGPVVLNGNQLNSDPAGGTRISLFRTDDCGSSLETTYIYAGNFFSERSLPFNPDSYAIASGIYGNIWGQSPPALLPPPLSSVQTQLLGRLQSLEFNSRTPLLGGKTLFISGIRWLQWQEQLLMSDEFINQPQPIVPPIGYDFYDTRCVNDLYGGQIGFDSQLLAFQSGLQVEGLVKAGAYYNSAVQQSSYQIISTADFFDTITVSGQPAAAAFVGEVGLTSVIPLRRNFSLRVGYFGLWVEAIAQPVAQLIEQDLTQPDTPPPTGKLVTSGGLVIQGISLGLEGRW